MEITNEILNKAAALAPVIRMLALGDGRGIVRFLGDVEARGNNVLTLSATDDETVKAEYAAFREKNGVPDSVFAESVGAFKLIDTSSRTGRLAGKITIVTGGAQGFGKGIAEAMTEEGAYVAIADMNYDGALKTASELNGAIAVRANVSDEQSVADMVRDTVLQYGGLDVFVNNAGIVRAGSLEEMTKANFELVTSVNYTAYFLCVKYASAVMKIQRRIAPEKLFDIIEINSKSGLAGSNKNFAYAGSKFGGIGLTQSFAMELAPYGIKVNAVCPGNFLEGPLWTDPERGLLVQYLKAGKVPGAKTTADVLKFYESKVPLGRGCRTYDVARAIFYICEQDYETGQAVPVTGGQEMLN
ncbi:MAG: SDR family oxidoreductase [Clostridia bacterium]|nr:SDR family oxidoreductase [Clostridia bacterium]